MAGSKTVKKTAEYTKRFDERYDELKSLLARGMPAESADIEDIYGVCGGLSPYNEFGMWS